MLYSLTTGKRDDMSEEWISSMNGAPWTKLKMIEATKRLRHRALISFVIDLDKLEDLQELDQRVFAERPDLILSVTQISNNKRSLEKLISTVAGLQHVRSLQLNLHHAVDLSQLSQLDQMQYLSIMSKKPISLSFISSFKQLQYAFLQGKFIDLSPIQDATQLDTLVLRSDIVALDFLTSLPKLTCLSIQDCTLEEEALAALAHTTVTMLRLAAIRNLTQIEDIASMDKLVSLTLALPKVEELCDFSKLHQLKQLELEQMKALKDITPLWTAKQLEMLTLREISPAIKAEALTPLLEMEKLKQLDFQFIDFNKGRIAELRHMFAEAGKTHILYESIEEPFRMRSQTLLQLQQHLGVGK